MRNPFEVETSRCVGHCCKAFFLPYSKEEMERKTKEGCFSPSDSQVAGMIIPLGNFTQLSPELQAMFPPGEHDESSNFYTCKNHDIVTGNCRVYETRPAMCKDYPYGHSCKYIGCKRTTEVDRARMDQLLTKAPEDGEKEVKGRPTCCGGGCRSSKPVEASEVGAGWAGRCGRWARVGWRSMLHVFRP